MLDIVFWVGVGAFVGWNLPQPWYAKALQEKFLSLLRRVTNKTDG